MVAMATIYIVTQGDYSSYRIVAPFSTMEAAEAFCSQWNGLTGDHDHYNEIEAYELDPPHPPVVECLDARYEVGVGGTLHTPAGWHVGPVRRAIQGQAEDEVFYAHVHRRGDGVVSALVRCAVDQDPHKIASDAAARFLAEEAGIA